MCVNIPITSNRGKVQLAVILSVLIAYGFLSSQPWKIFSSDLFGIEQSVVRTNGSAVLHPDNFKVPPYYNASAMTKLLDLNNIIWPNEPLASKPARPDRKLPAPFEPIMSRSQRNVYYRMLDGFASILSVNSLGDQFMLFAGSLIGSFRHHDFVPWDEDIDVWVNISVRNQVRKLLHTLAPEFILFESSPRDKLYPKPIDPSQAELDLEMSRPVENWGWPFLDICYFLDNQTHIVEWGVSLNVAVVLKRDRVIPLYFRPFGKHWYPAPRDPIGVIQWSYPNSLACQTTTYSHVLERVVPKHQIECKKLGKKYTFVQHRLCPTHAGMSSEGMVLSEERLVLLTDRNESVTSHAFCLAVTPNNIRPNPYTLE